MDVRPSFTEILPPFGTNPPPIATRSTGDILTRKVYNDPRELWYLALPNKLTPKQVLMILRSALGGDIWQQWQLFSLMLDSWPMLRKCCHELRSAVSQTKFNVKPFSIVGKEPTASAKKKADFVSQAMQAFRPDPMTDEKGFSGLVYDLTDAYINGIVMIELLWRDEPSQTLPRASAWVHPRHFTFTNGGKIAIIGNDWNEYQFPDPNKFLVGQYNSRSGSSLGAGMLRPLAWGWSAVMYNREWMLEFAQRFGQPFRWTTYKPGTPDSEIAKINDMMENLGAQGWANFVEGTDLKMEKPGDLGSQNPYVHIVERADKECQLLILGQTLTTDVHDSGSRALGQVHQNVRRERVEEVAQWVGRVLSEQFASAVCRLNYGQDDECPVIEPDFTQVADPLQTAQRYQILLAANVPLNAEEFYSDNALEMPEEGDLIIQGGKLGLQPSTDEELTPQAPPQPVNPAANGNQNGNGNGKPEFNGERNGKPNGIKARTTNDGSPAVPHLDDRIDLIQKARLEAFKPALRDLTKLAEAKDASEFKSTLEKIRAKLVEYGEHSAKNGKTADEIEALLADAMAGGIRKEVESQHGMIPHVSGSRAKAIKSKAVEEVLQILESRKPVKTEIVSTGNQSKVRRITITGRDANGRPRQFKETVETVKIIERDSNGSVVGQTEVLE